MMNYLRKVQLEIGFPCGSMMRIFKLGRFSSLAIWSKDIIKHSLNSKIFSFLSIINSLPELLQSIQDVLLDQELDENELEVDFFHVFLEVLIGEHHVITIAINKQDAFIFNLSVSSWNACCLQVVLLIPIATLDLADPRPFFFPLRRN